MTWEQVKQLEQITLTTIKEYASVGGEEMLDDIVRLENMYKDIVEFWGYEINQILEDKIGEIIEDIMNN